MIQKISFKILPLIVFPIYFIGCGFNTVDSKSGIDFYLIAATVLTGDITLLTKHLSKGGDPNLSAGSPKVSLFCALLSNEEISSSPQGDSALVMLARHGADVNTPCAPNATNFKSAVVKDLWALATLMLKSKLIRELTPEDFNAMISVQFITKKPEALGLWEAFFTIMPPSLKSFAGEILHLAVTEKDIEFIKLYKIFKDDLVILDFVKDGQTPYGVASQLEKTHPHDAATYETIKNLLISFGAKGSTTHKFHRTPVLPKPANWEAKDPGLKGPRANPVWGKPELDIEWASDALPEKNSVAYNDACAALKAAYGNTGKGYYKAFIAVSTDKACSENLSAGTVLTKEEYDYCMLISKNRAQLVNSCYGK